MKRANPMTLKDKPAFTSLRSLVNSPSKDCNAN